MTSTFDRFKTKTFIGFKSFDSIKKQGVDEVPLFNVCIFKPLGFR